MPRVHWHGCAGSRCQIHPHLAGDGHSPDFPALALKPNKAMSSELLERSRDVRLSTTRQGHEVGNCGRPLA